MPDSRSSASSPIVADTAPENGTIHQGKDSGLWTQDQTSQAAAVQPQLADLDEDGIIAGNGDLETLPDQLANVQA